MDNEVKERDSSPRPWRLEMTRNCLRIYDADCNIAFEMLSRFATPGAPRHQADMELIVDAVNAYDRVIAKEKAVADEITHLRQTLKKLADMYMDHTVWRLSRDEQALIDEARAAIGKEAARDH